MKRKLVSFIVVLLFALLAIAPLVESDTLTTNKINIRDENKIPVNYGTVVFMRTYNNLDADEAHSAIQTKDGGYLVVGSSRIAYENDHKIWVVKTDAYGDVEWEKEYRNTKKNSRCDIAKDVIETIDHKYLIIGSSGYYGDKNDADCWIIKINDEGNIEWDKTFGGEGWDEGRSIVETTDGYFVFTGRFSGYSPLIKIDKNGNTVWQKIFKANKMEGGGVQEGEMYSVIQTKDGGFLLTGAAYIDESRKNDAWIIKTDSNGNVVWHGFYDNKGGNDKGYSGIETGDSNYIITGKAEEDPSSLYSDVWVLKIDNKGAIVWSKTYPQGKNSWGNDITKTSDNCFVLTGSTLTVTYETDSFLIKIDKDGNEKWHRSIDHSRFDTGNSVKETSDGGFIIAGCTGDVISETTDFWLVKTDKEGDTRLRQRSVDIKNLFIRKLSPILQVIVKK